MIKSLLEGKKVRDVILNESETQFKIGDVVKRKGTEDLRGNHAVIEGEISASEEVPLKYKVRFVERKGFPNEFEYINADELELVEGVNK